MGHAYSISINSLKLKFPDEIESCTVEAFIRNKIIYNRNEKGSILKKNTFKYPEFGYPKIPEVVPYFDTDELKGMSAIALQRISMFREKVIHSSSVNGKNCVVKMFIKPDNVHRKVKFSHCTLLAQSGVYSVNIYKWTLFQLL